MRTLLSLIILGLSLSTGTAYAYLAPGEVFPDLNTAESVQSPVRAIPVMNTAVPIVGVPVVEEAVEESSATKWMLYLVGAMIAVVAGGILYRKKAETSY
jgi:hypothetical protein